MPSLLQENILLLSYINYRYDAFLLWENTAFISYVGYRYGAFNAVGKHTFSKVYQCQHQLFNDEPVD